MFQIAENLYLIRFLTVLIMILLHSDADRALVGRQPVDDRWLIHWTCHWLCWMILIPRRRVEVSTAMGPTPHGAKVETVL